MQSQSISRCICLLIQDEGITVGEFRHYGSLAGDAGVKLKNIGQLMAFGNEKINIRITLRRTYLDFIAFGLSEIVCMRVSAVDKHSPAVGAHHIGNGTVGDHVFHVHARSCIAARDALAAFVAETEKPFRFVEGNAHIKAASGGVVKAEFKRSFCARHRDTSGILIDRNRDMTCFDFA